MFLAFAPFLHANKKPDDFRRHEQGDDAHGPADQKGDLAPKGRGILFACWHCRRAGSVSDGSGLAGGKSTGRLESRLSRTIKASAPITTKISTMTASS